MTVGRDAVTVTGLRDLQAALKRLDGESQKKLRLVLNVAAEIVAEDARRKAGKDKKTGTAQRTIKVASSQRESRVKAGGPKAPYFGWLDFGGKNKGRHPTGKPIVRRVYPDGRYVYSAYYENKGEVMEALGKGLSDLIEESGLVET